jgi:hypothetical protein
MSFANAMKRFWSTAAGVVLSLLVAAALITLWLIWQGPDALPGVGTAYRLEATVVAILVLVLGSAVLLHTASPGVRKRFGWALAAVGLASGLTMWYSDSVLKVSPSSARIPEGSVLPLTAGPMTLIERIRGQPMIEWSSSDTAVAIMLASPGSVGSHLAMVQGVHAGRATIFAVRGRVRSETRLSIDSSGVIPPVCSVKGAPVINVRLSLRQRPTTPASGRATTKGATGSAGVTAAAGVSDACIAGSISSPGGQPVRRAKVSLKALSDTGDTLWAQYGLTDPVDGRFEFRVPGDSDRPPASFLLSVHQQVGETNPVWFLPTQWGLDTASRVLDARLLRAGAFRNGVDIKLQYSSQSAFSILLLLLPAIFGLTTTVLYYSESRKMTTLYVLGNVLAWGLLLALFAVLYAFRGVQSIPLFGDRISVPTVAPTFAYLGVLVYAIYVLAADYVEALRSQRPAHSTDRELMLLSLVNRIVIAPYVAIVAIVAVFSKLDHPMIPFVAFFTGLWIEPVLGTLKEIGDRLVRRSDPPESARALPLADLLDQAKRLLQQERATLLKDEPNSTADAVATTTANGKEAVKVVVYLEAPDAEFDTRAKAFPTKLEGTLPDGTALSVPVEVQKAG